MQNFQLKIEGEILHHPVCYSFLKTGVERTIFRFSFTTGVFSFLEILEEVSFLPNAMMSNNNILATPTINIFRGLLEVLGSTANAVFFLWRIIVLGIWKVQSELVQLYFITWAPFFFVVFLEVIHSVHSMLGQANRPCSIMADSRFFLNSGSKVAISNLCSFFVLR